MKIWRKVAITYILLLTFSILLTGIVTIFIKVNTVVDAKPMNAIQYIHKNGFLHVLTFLTSNQHIENDSHLIINVRPFHYIEDSFRTNIAYVVIDTTNHPWDQKDQAELFFSSSLNLIVFAFPVFIVISTVIILKLNKTIYPITNEIECKLIKNKKSLKEIKKIYKLSKKENKNNNSKIMSLKLEYKVSKVKLLNDKRILKTEIKKFVINAKSKYIKNKKQKKEQYEF